MLDVHILTLPDRRGELLNRALASVNAAIERAPFPVRLHLVESSRGVNMVQKRLEAYSLGDYPYVASVDDDDWVEPDIFASLQSGMESEAPAIYTHAMREWPSGKTLRYCKPMFFRCFRREVALSAKVPSQIVGDGFFFIVHADRFGSPVVVPRALYHHNDAQETRTPERWRDDTKMVLETLKRTAKWGSATVVRNRRSVL